MIVKRKIEEINSINKLEPEIKEIFVEGECDRRMIGWFLNRNDVKDVKITSIDLVEIPEALIEEYELNHGSNRSKVIALAKKLDSTLKYKDNHKYIIDKDFYDYIEDYPAIDEIKNLVMTDYVSIENYLIRNEVVEKFVEIYLHGFPIDSCTLLKFIEKPLKDLFRIRLINERMKYGYTLVSIKKYINVSISEVLFKVEDYLDSFLKSNNNIKNYEKYKNEISKVKLKDNLVESCRGHDYMEFLFIVFKTLKEKKMKISLDSFESCVFCCVDDMELHGFLLFKELLEFTA